MTRSDLILLIEDDHAIAEVVVAYLRDAGYTVVHADRGQQGLAIYRDQQPALVVLDLMLPDIPGELLCSEIKKERDTPVIMLTAKSSEEQRLIGFSLGADDYLVKPFSARELVFRVKIALRRSSNLYPPVETERQSFNRGALQLDPDGYRALVNGMAVEFSGTEFRLLLRLASAPGKVFSRDELLEKVLGYTCEGYERCIDAHIKNIRHKLGDNPRTPVYIESVYGVGYRFNGMQDS